MVREAQGEVSRDASVCGEETASKKEDAKIQIAYWMLARCIKL